jgi:endogenous inhibitor of DNA gyrase (YacG/DUF329 family)
MTKTQIDQIIRLRGNGFGYMKIAAALSLSANTVKSYCRRHALGGAVAKDPSAKIGGDFCKECGNPLTHNKKKKPRKFCSDACRMAWWRSHCSLLKRKAFYALACAFCGKQFESYGNKKRKFCGRACYANSKRKGCSHE